MATDAAPAPGNGKLIGGALAAAILVSMALIFPVKEWLVLAIEQIEAAGPAGAVAFAALYAVCTVAMVPGSILTLAAGLLYGPVLGFFVVWVGSNTGATMAFMLGRTLFRDRMEAMVATKPKFAALEGALEKEGFKLVLLMRMSPVFPFTLLNYGLGIMPVRLSHFIAASLIGMAPGTFLFVYLGSTAGELGSLLSGGAGDTGLAGQALTIGGLVATILVTVLITRTARKALSERLEEAQ